ncbi:NUDIX hydrolase [bacterium]|nr:MAG: NUDIX hydrolase [bacterium]
MHLVQRYEVLETRPVFEGHFKVDEATIKIDDAEPIHRLSVERGDAAAVLIHRLDSDELILVRQFRYPTVRHGIPELLEIVAGNIDAGETPDKAAIREAQEETGYKLSMVVPIAKFFGSPGGLSELMHIYYAPVEAGDRVGKGGGLEGEGVEVVTMPMVEALKMLETPQAMDGKLLVALYWLRTRQSTLGVGAGSASTEP